MARLFVYLPPFAGDYSGVCSTLFGLDCLVVLVDAGCCTHNYTDYDEPRWSRRRKAAFSAQLRTLDAVLGDDAKLIAHAVEGVQRLQARSVAIVGSPVPAITGMDMQGIAIQIEMECGVPAFGFETTGFDTYEHGVSMALRSLVDRFAVEREVGETQTAQNMQCAQGARGAHGSRCIQDSNAASLINVLGENVHDFMPHERAAMLEVLEQAGAQIAFCTDEQYAISDVASAANASANFVVSWSGLAAAQLLEQRFGIPYVVGRPQSVAEAKAMLKQAARKRNQQAQTDCADTSASNDTRNDSACVEGAALGDALDTSASNDDASDAPLLLIGEQVAMNSLRKRLRASDVSTASRQIVVASFFQMEPSWMAPNDIQLNDELQLIEFADHNAEFEWMGDPLFSRIPGFENNLVQPIAHEAVSSMLYLR